VVFAEISALSRPWAPSRQLGCVAGLLVSAGTRLQVVTLCAQASTRGDLCPLPGKS
jgi:hypothetical protein